MTPEDFFEERKGITVESAFKVGAKYNSIDMCRFAKAYHEARTKADIKGLTNIRNYFGENDRTPFEHRAYNFLDTYIKSISESIN